MTENEAFKIVSDFVRDNELTIRYNRGDNLWCVSCPPHGQIGYGKTLEAALLAAKGWLSD